MKKQSIFVLATAVSFAVTSWAVESAFAGQIVAWGNNTYGQCNAPSGNDFVAIAAGEYHSLALKSDGSLVAWGLNKYSQCDVPAGNNFTAIACGGYHSLALKSDGSLAAGDSNNQRQFDVPAGKDFVAIMRGWKRGLGLACEPYTLLLLGLCAVMLYRKR